MTGRPTGRPASTCYAPICACHMSPIWARSLPRRNGLPFEPAARFVTRFIRVITAHLNSGATVSWQGLNFDFTGVVFDGGSFANAVFSGGQVYFIGARFSGGQVNFDDAEFTGGTVHFNDAEVTGGEGQLQRRPVRRRPRSAFSGARVLRRRRSTSDGAQVRRRRGSAFSGARFAGGQVDFSERSASPAATVRLQQSPRVLTAARSASAAPGSPAARSSFSSRPVLRRRGSASPAPGIAGGEV